VERCKEELRTSGSLSPEKHPNFFRAAVNPTFGSSGDVRDFHSLNHTIVYWIPDFFWQALRNWVPKCPCCRSSAHVKLDSFTRSARRIVTLDSTLWLFSRAYRCRSCPGQPAAAAAPGTGGAAAAPGAGGAAAEQSEDEGDESDDESGKAR
jgi:hypothetical protein